MLFIWQLHFITACNEDLSVTFKGVNGAIEYFPAANKTDSCTIENISGHNGNFEIAKECLSVSID